MVRAMNAQPPPPPPPPPSQQPGQPGAPGQAIPTYQGVSDDSPGGPGDGKPSGGLRALGVVGLIVLGLAALIGFIAFADISGTTPCEDVTSFADLNSDGECYDGSSGLKTVVTIMGFIGSGLLAIAAIMSLMFAIRGRNGRQTLMVMGAGIALFGLALIIG